MTFEVVLCRYDETEDDMNKDFLYSGHTVVYNKGGPLDIKEATVFPCENVGREVHAYLYHIVCNYDDLPDVTLFSQCKTSDHPNILSLSTYLKTHSFRAVVEHQGAGFLTCDPEDSRKSGWGHINWPKGRWESAYTEGQLSQATTTIREFLEQHVVDELPDPDRCVTLFAGTFSVTRTCVRSRPKPFYERLLNIVSRHPQPEEIHYLERVWAYVFLPCEALNKFRRHLELTDGV